MNGRTLHRLPLALLALTLALGLGGCGGSGEETSGDSSAAATTRSTMPSAGDGGQSQGGQGGKGQGGRGGGSGRDDPEEQGGGSGSGGSGSGSGTHSGDRFAAQLRSIVSDAFVELQPLAVPATAISDPEAYAGKLEDGVGELDDTLDQLEALDPPADAERGTQQVIDAFSGLRGAVASAADAYGSGDPQQRAAALLDLRAAAGKFGAGIQKATASLRDAGYGLPGR